MNLKIIALTIQNFVDVLDLEKDKTPRAGWDKRN